MIPYSSRKTNLTFNITNYKSSYNPIFNIVKISYQIKCFDSDNNSILPSDLTLFHNLHIFCFLSSNTINITSLASIENNENFKCVEFVKSNEKIKFGPIIYTTKIKKERIFINLKNNLNNINYQHDENNFYNESEIEFKYKFSLSKLKIKNKLTKAKKLEKLYMSKPLYLLKRNFPNSDNQWNFANLYNEYFCFCKGFNCLDMNISKICKYKYYLFLIDKNQHRYEKTHFLLMDFIFKKYASADVYPIFEGMIKRNISAHYLTERKDLYEKYCQNNKYCLSVIQVNESNFKINGDFLEKYFTLFLKLKLVLFSGGVNINFINNLFYNIDYITFICIGHGVSYFKYYLYGGGYGPKIYDKLLIPNVKKLIEVPIKYGWKEEDLIKWNLPRWDKYNYYNESNDKNKEINSNSIFIMFTWRELKKNGEISKHYINNIVELINNKELINNLQKHNLTLYFSLHHCILKYKKKFRIGNSIKYIYENDIAECLSKIKLLVTDYSSIIFDIIYRNKPYIIFIPDANDPNIKQNYKNFCYNIIKNIKNNIFSFENVFLDINSTINKINYYINNDFILDIKLKHFYDEFNFKQGPFINDFINYLIGL